MRTTTKAAMAAAIGLVLALTAVAPAAADHHPTDDTRPQQGDHDADQPRQREEPDLVTDAALPGLFADPNIVRFGDTYYLYPTTDGFDGWSGTQFRAFSSTDLVNWTDHGVILDVATDISWADNSAWAPGIAEKDGKYYFYFSAGLADGDTGKHLGVAVADSPTGPFSDALGEPLVPAGTYSGQMIDPAVFTDGDGQPYLYWGARAPRTRCP